MKNDPIGKVSASKYAGLGDVVSAIAKPIAVGLDRLLHTDLANCPGCFARRVHLNRLLPFKKR